MENAVNILIIGDSIGYGIGDNENKGIGERYKNLVGKNNKTEEIILHNISVPGYESKDLLSLIEKKENNTLLRNADLIIISIGGNDINRIEFTDNLSLKRNYKKTLDRYKTNLKFILNKVRESNKNAKIAMLGLYNPSEGNDSFEKELLIKWNFKTKSIINNYKNSRYVDIHDNFKSNLNEYLAEDKFHPSSSGYDIITKKLYESIN